MDNKVIMEQEEIFQEEFRQWVENPVTRLVFKELNILRKDIRDNYIRCKTNSELHWNRGREEQMLVILGYLKDVAKKNTLKGG